MNKRASITTSTVRAVSYPDVIGFITGGKHLNLDALQSAVGTRPTAINAGKQFELLVLLQNCLDLDIDAVIRLGLPEKDQNGQKGRFTTSLTKPIRIGLRPGEVGVVNLPALATSQAAPGNYAAMVEVVVEQKQRGGMRVRDASGGSTFNPDDVPEDRRASIQALNGLNFSSEVSGKAAGNKAILTAPFTILPATISGLPQELKPGYTSLWINTDYPDEGMLIQRAAPLLATTLPTLNRGTVFFPILKAVQNHFEQAQFRLWAGEAVVIAKLMMLVIEMGMPKTKPGESVTYPRWYIKLSKILLQHPEVISQTDRLVAESLFSELLHDSALLGFAMINTVTREDFGSKDEMETYASGLVAALTGKGEQLDFIHAYLPLVLAGIIANSRVSMPQEQVRDTAAMVAEAREKRSSLMDDNNKFIFDIADDLIERALEHF